MILTKFRKLAQAYLEHITLRDTVLLYKIKKTRTPGRTLLMRFFTLIGSGGAVWMLDDLVLLARRKTRLDGVLLFTGAACNIAVNNLFTKIFFKRERPCQRYPDEYVPGSLGIGYSFPSGHALNAFTSATILTLSRPVNALWAFPLAIAVGYSRAYLFAHYPSDIIAGAVIGTAEGIVIYYVGHYLYDHDLFPWANRLIDSKHLSDYAIEAAGELVNAFDKDILKEKIVPQS